MPMPLAESFDAAPEASIQYRLSAQEALRWVRTRRPWVYRLIAVPPILAAFLGLIVTLLVPSEVVLSASLFALAALFTIMAVSMSWLSPVLAQRRSPEVFQQEIAVTLDRDGVHARRGSISTDAGWDGLDRISIDGRFVTIWSGRSAIVIVPVRAFATSADRESFVAVARSHLRGAAVAT
jgi:hypothetical protein